MPDTSMVHGTGPVRGPATAEIHILWMTAGLGCDGDTVAMTAATQPAIEDVLLGGLPGLPKVHLHKPLPGSCGYQVEGDHCARVPLAQ